MFRYWIILLKADNNSVIKRIYCMLKNDADNNVSYNNNNWAYQIKLMLQNLGLGGQINNIVTFSSRKLNKES